MELGVFSSQDINRNFLPAVYKQFNTRFLKIHIIINDHQENVESKSVRTRDQTVGQTV